MSRRPIATRYAALVVALLSIALLASGTVETWFSHRERQAALEALQREKAQAAATEVSRFVDDVLRSLDWVTLYAAPAGDELDRRRLDFLKLLRLVPAITTATLVDAQGRERLRISRIKPDRLGSDIDISVEPGFKGALQGQAHFGDVYFVAETEPYLTIGAPSAARDGSVVLADVNLKFVWNVVSGIRIGAAGYAYVVDAKGRLVSHPDISRVLQMTDMSQLPQVQSASGPANPTGFTGDGRDPAGVPVLSAYAKIAPLNWTVFVEQPRAEAFAPLVASIERSALILLAALALAVAAGIVAARRMVAPIGELRRGAQRFGAGDLSHHIEVTSGDELQELATQFNAMGERLRETYESLERRVAERTRDLNERNADITEALEQQTATAEILRVISSSPTDTGPVFETIVSNTLRLCEANFAAVFLFERKRLYTPAHTKVATRAFAEYIEQGFPANRGTTAGRAALERKPVQIIDILADPEFDVTPAHRAEGIRTVLSVPMLHEGAVVGVVNAWRHEVRPFSDKQMKLLETFARQAVIAIDNIRLFNELETRNRELAEALAQQTATAEVLRVISSSPTEAKPVFEAIVRNAARLCNANFAFVMLNHDGWLSLAAHTDCTAEFAAFLERGFPASRGTTSGRAAMERRPVQVLDFLSDADVNVTQEHQAENIRTVLAVPMVRDDRVLGVIAIWRREVREFSDKQVKLLETFADQAVIAVENLRLFNEIQETSRKLDLANQAKSRFLAAASHDLRQPMHALSLFVGQLRASRTPADRGPLVQRIEEAVGSLSDLLDQLLDLSKLEAGAVQAVQEEFAVGDTLAAIETQFAPLARAKGITLRVHATSAWANSDPLLVQRVLLNLVANAIRYTDRGGVLIGCRKRGDRVRITVWDTGCGIPDERREDVFREFVQLGNERRQASGVERAPVRGLGLGLAIVARLADLLGTRIELVSRVGRGSMFGFELALGTASAMRARPAAAPLRIASLRGVFALVVDDDEAARAGTCGLLQSWGCLTLSASDGEGAIAQLRSHDRPPELIVCDYRLGPSENGVEAIARIRATVAEDVPAIIVTADTAAEVTKAAQAAGVPLLHKPVSPVKLRALLAQVFARASGAHRAAA